MTSTVLVTGGAGFIGAHLVRHLAARGDTVRVLDDLSSGFARYLDGVACELRVGAVGDAGMVSAALAGVDAVVHLAARAGIPDSIADPLGTLEANVTRTVELLEAARGAGVRRFILASTNAAIGDHLPPLHEDLPAHPVSPYGASKLAGEAWVQAYAASFGMAACAVRFSNAYGSWALHKKSVVAAWIRDAVDGRPITIYGDGSQTRDFVHADDLAAGVAAAIDAEAGAVAGQLFQLGTGVETSVAGLARILRDAVGGDLEIRFEPARAGDVPRNVSQVSKAADRLGWTPTVELEAGIRRTLAWFRMALADPSLAGISPNVLSGSD
jgi:UDP-glucose 4-epimerase